MKYSVYIKSEQRSIKITEDEFNLLMKAKESNPSGQFCIKGSFYDLKDLMPRTEDGEFHLNQITYFIKGRKSTLKETWSFIISKWSIGETVYSDEVWINSSNPIFDIVTEFTPYKYGDYLEALNSFNDKQKLELNDDFFKSYDLLKTEGKSLDQHLFRSSKEIDRIEFEELSQNLKDIVLVSRDKSKEQGKVGIVDNVRDFFSQLIEK